MTEPVDEELWQPPVRRISRKLVVALVALVAVAAVGTVIVVSRHGADDPPPAAAVRPSAPPAATTTSAGPTIDVAGPPTPLVDAVRDVFPKARLSLIGLEVTADPDPARNYQFVTPRRRITVVVGRPDGRATTVRSGLNSVVVVRVAAGRRVAVTVQAVRGRVAVIDGDAAARLARDARLLATA